MRQPDFAWRAELWHTSMRLALLQQRSASPPSTGGPKVQGSRPGSLLSEPCAGRKPLSLSFGLGRCLELVAQGRGHTVRRVVGVELTIVVEADIQSIGELELRTGVDHSRVATHVRANRFEARTRRSTGE